MTPSRSPVSRVLNSARTTNSEISVLYDLCLDGAEGVLVREDPVMDRLSESIRQATISSPKLLDHPSPPSPSIRQSSSNRQSQELSAIAGNKLTETIARNAKALAKVGAGPFFSSEMVDDDMTDLSLDGDLLLEDDIIMDDESHPLSPRERSDIRSLAKFFDSIHLQDGADNSRSPAVRFLLWGISPFIKMISTTLRRLAETGARDLEKVAAARVLAGVEGDELEAEDPSMLSAHQYGYKLISSAFSW